MGQTEIIEWLKRHPSQKFTARQLMTYTGLGKFVIYVGLKKLRKASDKHMVFLKYETRRYEHKANKFATVYWWEDDLDGA